MYSSFDSAVDSNTANFDGGHRTSPTSQSREGFNSNSGNSDAVASYGAGAGSDASDLANTGLGGYGTSAKVGGAQGPNENEYSSTKMPGGWEGSNPQLSSESNREGGGERREGFGDSHVGAGGDTTSSYGTGPGAGASDPANTGLGGYGSSTKGASMFGRNEGSQAQGGGTGNVHSQIEDARAKGTKAFDDYEGGHRSGGEQKVTGADFADQATGYAEQVAGSLTGNQGLRERGQERSAGK